MMLFWLAVQNVGSDQIAREFRRRGKWRNRDESIGTLGKCAREHEREHEHGHMDAVTCKVSYAYQRRTQSH